MEIEKFFEEEKGITVDAALNIYEGYTAIDMCKFAKKYHDSAIENSNKNIKYKCYKIKIDDITKQSILIESDFNYGCGFDSIEEAIDFIQRNGDDYVQYTFLPYIYMNS
jgi:hypothetical protein